MAKSKLINKKTRDKIVVQALDEISHARLHKRSTILEWHKNEDIIEEKISNSVNSARTTSKFKRSGSQRSSVALHKADGFIQTVLSKIDTPLAFTFQAQHVGDKKGSELLNALVEADRETDDWDYKDILGKKQAIAYGRVIYSYYATSDDGYEANNKLVDPYDFLIDPNGGGESIQDARFCGAYNIKIERNKLKKGKYIKSAVDKLLDGSGDNDSKNQEDIDKDNRYAQLNRASNREKHDPDLFKFWNWYTTYEGEKYYLVLSEDHGDAIRLEKLEDITKSDRWPYWSWAVRPDSSEFWTPSMIGLVREVFMAQNIAINQMIDNADRINNPQRAIDVTKILDESELRYKKNGKIRFKADTNINNALQVLETPSIDTPLAVYDTLESIQQLVSGVTNAVQGVAEEDKVGIYEGNVSAAADRFNLLNKAYAHGYKQFAHLYKWGVQEHLKKKKAVKLIGPEGVEVENINYKDVKPLADYLVSVQASTAESAADFRDKREKLDFLGSYIGSGVVNDTNAFEMEAEIVGFDRSDIRRLTDVKNSVKAEVISEAARDIELIITGKEILPNLIADQAYSEYLYRYMRDKKENLDNTQFLDLMDYFQAIQPIVRENMVYELQDQAAEQGQLGEEGLSPDLIPQEGQQMPEPQMQDMPQEQAVAGDMQQQQFAQGENLQSQGFQ